MKKFLLVLAAITTAVFVRLNVDVRTAKKRIAQLQDIDPIDAAEAPPVSVVIPACNEEVSIEHALKSVLGQEYPSLEVIVVDDRSTDRTGGILDRMISPRLRVLHIRSLPEGWLGKNHALQAGAAIADGEWILFTDADVVMEPSVVSRALRYATQHAVDHLAMAPRAIVHGLLSKIFVAGFALMFGMHTRPWKVRDPKAKDYIGIGAFGLVRASAYRSVGGHERIRMRPDDDLKLGKLVKYSGFRSDFVSGAELLCVEWYRSFAELRNGLMKNFFSVFNYRVSAAAFACLALLLAFVWPVVAAVFLRGAVRWMNVAALIALGIAFGRSSGAARIRWYWCFALPVASCLTVYLIARAAYLTIRNDGIDWRGTHYALAELRANDF